MTNETNGIINSSSTLATDINTTSKIRGEVVNPTDVTSEQQLFGLAQQFIEAVQASQADSIDDDNDVQSFVSDLNDLPPDIRDKAITAIDSLTEIMEDVAEKDYTPNELKAIQSLVVDAWQGAGSLAETLVGDRLTNALENYQG